jgi:DNA-binding response OmpR family regulator
MGQAELWTRSAVIIDDDNIVARLLQFILEGEGYSVSRVSDGRAARELIAKELPPDLVTLDFMLPDATGLELLAEMRSTVEWKHVPVLMLSAEPLENLDLTFGSDGILAYMEKPFRPEELRACISRLLNETALHRVHRRAAVNLARHSRRY